MRNVCNENILRFSESFFESIKWNLQQSINVTQDYIDSTEFHQVYKVMQEKVSGSKAWVHFYENLSYRFFIEHTFNIVID